MKPLRMVSLVLLSLVISLNLVFVDLAQAKGKKIVWSSALAMYPEFAEGYGVNAIVNHLKGRFETNPALKDKYNFLIYDKGMLYPNQEEHLQALSNGAIQMTYSGPHYLEALHQAWKLGESPGVFENYDHFLRTMQTPAWQKLHEEMARKHNVTILKWGFNTGSWYLFTKDAPLKEIGDIKGEKIRYAGGEAFAKALKALNTSPVALPYTEVVTALQTNMIDGLVTDFTGGVGYYELARYAPNTILVPFSIQPICFVVNTKWWEGLDEDTRKEILHVFEVTDLQKFYLGMEASEIDAWRNDSSKNVFDPSKEVIREWQGLMRGSITDMINKIDKEYLEAIEASK